jgi:hypothetical protein
MNCIIFSYQSYGFYIAVSTSVFKCGRICVCSNMSAPRTSTEDNMLDLGPDSSHIEFRGDIMY